MIELRISQRYGKRAWSLSTRSIRDTLVPFAPDYSGPHGLGVEWTDRTAKAMLARIKAHYGEGVQIVQRAWNGHSRHGFTVWVQE